tara:strand:- start:31530 stop:33761 length:2232 start_codon:yes stop_codon:yes gene_type:complete
MKKLLLITTALVMPTHAAADPLTALVAGLGFGSATTAAVALALYPGIYAVGAFLSGTVGSLLLNLGVSAALSALNRPKAPTVEAARINTRLNDATRWQAGGKVMIGGEVGTFGEYDASGNLWYIVTHADSEMEGSPRYFLDGVEVELDVDGYVTTDEFCSTSGDSQYEGTGTKTFNWRIWSITPDASNVYGQKPSEFTDAFPDLPEDFHLAGVSYTIVRGRSVPLANYSKVYRFRGSLGLGEPSLAVYENFSRMYDPRNPAHLIDDSSTWSFSTGNSAIVWAWFRTNPRGRDRPMSEIDWGRVAIEANKCDALVLDRAGGLVPRYRCGAAFPDNKPRHECEQEILESFDAFVVYGADGKAWPRAGVYEAATLEFTAERDIYTAETQVIDDGEIAVDGVVVNYLSPEHGFTKQASAPWINTHYYDGVSEPNYQIIDRLTCQNHNQAVRLGKAFGLRSAATKRAGLGTTVKGILASGERNILLRWDGQFDGNFEIVTPVEIDGGGLACAFAVVPMQPDRYTLLAGEEGTPPAPTPDINIDNGLVIAQNVVVNVVSVLTSSGAAVRFEATFDAPSRPDRIYEFRYRISGGIPLYSKFATNMEELTAQSSILQDGTTYEVQWRTIAGAGRASDWAADVGGGETELVLLATANPTAPADLIAADAIDSGGEATITWSTANDMNQAAVRVYRGALFSSSALVTSVVTPANTDSGTIEPIAPGTYSYWAVPVNGSGVEGNPTGPLNVTVT